MFGKRLKTARTEKGYTLEELAKQYNARFGGGLSKGTLSKYENEKQLPMITVVSNLSSILNVSADYLLGRDEETARPRPAEDEQLRRQNRERILSMLDQLSEDRRQLIENLIALEWKQQQQK